MNKLLSFSFALLCLNLSAQQPFITTWKTDNPGSSCSTCIEIPTSAPLSWLNYNYSYDIDWENDGVYDDFGVTENITHNYGTAGTYDIAIRGVFPHLYNNFSTDAAKLIDVKQWGDIQWLDMRSAFKSALNFNMTATDVPNLTLVTNMQEMFRGATNFDGDISAWDVSSITNMQDMFVSASNFNKNLNNWDVSSVNTMDGMFRNAILFDGDISNWNTSSLTRMVSMFNNAASFNQDISNWDVSGVDNMHDVFGDAASFNQDISNWSISQVLFMGGMFNGASSFNQDLSNWDVSQVKSMDFMFNGAFSFNQDISNWDVSEVIVMDGMFLNASSFDQDLGTWNITSITNTDPTFPQGLTHMLDNSGMSQNNYESTLAGWAANPNTRAGNVLGADGLVYCDRVGRDALVQNLNWTITGDTFIDNCSCPSDPFITTWKTDNPGTSCSTCIEIPTNDQFTYSYDVDWDNDGIYDDFGVTGNIVHDYGVTGTYDVAICGDFPAIYFNNEKDKSKIIDVKQWGDIEWQDMRSSFKGIDFSTITALDVPDLRTVSSMSSMFSMAINFNTDIGNWDVSNIERLDFLFFGANSFNHYIGNWDVSNVLSMGNMFAGASTFNQDISNWDVSNVTSMSNIFRDAFDFNQDIGNWDVSNVSSMQSMFRGAFSFNQDIGNWDVSSARRMDSMFQGSTSFNQDLSQWNVSTVEQMWSMFNGARLFESDLSLWNVGNVINLGSMFNQALNFDSDLSNWNLGSLFFNSSTTITQEVEAMLNNSGLSQSNYEATLLGWAQNPDTPQNLDLGALNLEYCDETGREMLISNLGWTIDGDARTCTSHQSFITTWKTDNPGMSCNSCIEIPTTAHLGDTYCYDVDWENDGIYDDFCVTGNITHDYGAAGVYNVAIKGVFPRIHFGSQIDNSKITDIIQWGDISWQSMENAFFKADNLQMSASDQPDLSLVTSMSSMFRGATNFNGDLTQWNVSNVKYMWGLFFDASFFNQDLSSWDVSNVEDMGHMFRGAKSFNQNIGIWDISQVESLNHMFAETDSFNQDISSWNVSNATDMAFMFAFASTFNQDINSWDVSNVETMSHMFNRATAFNQDISIWDVSKVRNMARMFDQAITFNHNLGLWDISQLVLDDPNRNDTYEGLEKMLNNSGLSQANYEATLFGWAQNPDTPQDLELGSLNLEYCDETGRDMLIDDLGWTITGDVKADNCETCPNVDNITLSLDNIGLPGFCTDTWTESGIDFSFSDPSCVSLDCSVGIGNSSVWLFPATLNIDLTSVINLSIIEIDIIAYCPENCTVANLLNSNGEEISSASNISLQTIETLTLINRYGLSSNELTICASETQILEVRIISGLNSSASICSPDPITAQISSWQSELETSYEAVIDDNNTHVEINYSTEPISSANPTPNNLTATGIHSGADNCTAETQLTYAYLQCYGDDGQAGNDDDSFILLGTHTLTVYPLVQAPDVVTDGCIMTVSAKCSDVVTLSGQTVSTGVITNNNTGVVSYSSASEDPAGMIGLAVVSGISGSTCTYTDNLTTPACDNTAALADPCSCTNPQNYALNGTYYFKELVEITGTTGQSWNMTSITTGGIFDASGTAIPLPFLGTETPAGSGIYQWAFWHVDGTGFCADYEEAGGMTLDNCNSCDLPDAVLPLTTDLGLYSCMDVASIPACPTSLAEAMADPYNISLSEMGCDDLFAISCADSEAVDCDGGMQEICRTVTLIYDVNDNGIQDADEEISEVKYTFQTMPVNTPTLRCSNTSVKLNASGVANITPADLVTHAGGFCSDNLSYTASKTNFDCSDLEDNGTEIMKYVTITVTDNCNNSAICRVMVSLMPDYMLASLEECSCDASKNYTISGVEYFHRVDKVVGSTDQNWTLDRITGNAIYDMNGNPIALPLTGTHIGCGVYIWEYWHTNARRYEAVYSDSVSGSTRRYGSR